MGAAESIFNVFPFQRVKSPGHGVKARNRLSNSSAVISHWASPSTLSSFLVTVAWPSSCGRGLTSPVSQAGRFSRRRSAPKWNSLGVRLSLVASAGMDTALLAMIGPLSIPSSRRISVVPVCFSPFRMAVATGDGPRYLGSSEGCTFTDPRRGIFNTSVGRIFPYAATIVTSGRRDASCCCASARRKDAG